MSRMTVTSATGELHDLAHRFGAELTTLHGTYEVADSPAEARLSLLNRLNTWIELDEVREERRRHPNGSGTKRTLLGSGLAARARFD